MADPSHVDLSVLWVPIMPETSKFGAAMEQLGKDAIESFDKGFGKDTNNKLGDKITDSVTKSNDKIKDTFKKTGSDATDSMADGVKENSKKVEDAIGETGDKVKRRFGETAKGLGKQLVDAIGPDTKQMLGDRLEEVVSGSLDGVLGDKAKWGGKLARAVGDWGLDALKTKLGGVEKAVGDVSDHNTGKLAALAGNFGKVKDLAHVAGVEIGNLPEPIQDVVNKTNDIKTQAQGFADVFKNLPGKIGVVGTAIGELAGPLAALGVVIDKVNNAVDKAGGARHWDDVVNPSDAGFPGYADDPGGGGGGGFWGAAGRIFQSWVPGGTQSNSQPKPPGAPNGSQYNGMLLGGSGSSDQASSDFNSGGDPNTWKGTIGSGGDAYDALSGGSPWPLSKQEQKAKDQADKADARAAAAQAKADDRAATDQERAEARAERDRAKADAHDARVAGQVGGGGGRMPTRNVGSDKGLTPTSSSVKAVVSTLFPQIKDIGGWRPPDGYNEHSSGQALDVMIPNSTTPQGKALGDQISQYVLAHAKELGVDYTIWQHGQHNPDGSFQMYPDRGGPTQNHMDHVHIHTVKGGGSGDPNELVSAGVPAGMPLTGGMGAGGSKMPSGAQHDPLYVMPADTGSGSSGSSGGGSDAQDLSSQFGSGFLGGIAQSVGLDGSVFKGFGGASNPMNFGITKLATGLLNHASHGAGVSQNAIPVGPGGAQTGSTGATITNHIDNSFTANGIGTPQEQKEAFNAKPPPVSSGVPGGGGFPVAGVP